MVTPADNSELQSLKLPESKREPSSKKAHPPTTPTGISREKLYSSQETIRAAIDILNKQTEQD